MSMLVQIIVSLDKLGLGQSSNAYFEGIVVAADDESLGLVGLVVLVQVVDEVSMVGPRTCRASNGLLVRSRCLSLSWRLTRKVNKKTRRSERLEVKLMV